ncbi:MAG: sulfite exporter TauE/SafE family protein [Lutibacter sp.]|nr:sulfite exporter TauE/SafE family protein [Lutibacter sp.]
MQGIVDSVIQFQLSWLNWFLAFLAALILGMGKAGIKGLGVLIVTLMAIIFGGKASTGILIPLMVVADILAVFYYNRHTQWKFLLKILPTMVLGVLVGVWFGNDISEKLFKQIMAIFIILTVIMMVWMDQKKSKAVPKHWFFASSMGFLSGITSMIGNLAGSFADIYFLAIRLPKNQFIGTAAWLFLIINVFKLPFHIFVWKTVTSYSLLLNLFLVPAILIGFISGVALVKLLNNEVYRKFIMVVTAIGALLMFFR